MARAKLATCKILAIYIYMGIADLVADAFSGQFLRSIPFSDDLWFTNAAWTVAVATYAGVPIPQAAPFVGVPLKCKSPNKPILGPDLPGVGRGDCQGSGRVSTGFVGMYGTERVAAVQGRLREVAGQVD